MKSIVEISRLLSDTTRVTMLTALMSGKALTAGELAKLAHVSPQTASSHLEKMLRAKLIIMRASGRHRYFALASDQVAELLEAIGQLAPMQSLIIPGHDVIDAKLKFARTCYHHLAGELAIQLIKKWLNDNYIVQENEMFSLTNKGIDLFLSWNMDILTRPAYSQGKACLDWTERQFHISGALGKELLHQFLKHDWLRKSKTHRALIVTEKGKYQFSLLNLK